ncbi:hypothetical protein RRG08_046745 [Elysia crispata]|uniref:Uncharacterized protein n=1 Tax=Elysia crispata TaxID=231223 RepID=A0AAE0ZUT3_9GAST|nr:hypothetical protein RRG08_046745 [Elysia crispata]
MSRGTTCNPADAVFVSPSHNLLSSMFECGRSWAQQMPSDWLPIFQDLVIILGVSVVCKTQRSAAEAPYRPRSLAETNGRFEVIDSVQDTATESVFCVSFYSFRDSRHARYNSFDGVSVLRKGYGVLAA